MAVPHNQVKIPDFTSATEDFTARQFIESVESVGSTFNWTDEQKLGAAKAHLKGPARRWQEWLSDRDDDKLNTLEKFKKEFLKRFAPNKSIAEQVKSMSSLKQKEGEDVLEFYERVDTVFGSLTQSIMPSERARTKGLVVCRTHFVILQYIHGLRPSIRAMVEAQVDAPQQESDVLRSVDTILEIAKRVENADMDKKKTQQVAAVDFQPQTQRTGGFNSGFRGRGRGRGPRGRGSGYRPPFSQLGSNSQSFGQIASRRRWIFCRKCKRWARHYARECPWSDQQISCMVPEDENNPPRGEPTDDFYDESKVEEQSKESPNKK